MANIKSAIKRIRTSERNRLLNKSRKSAIRTYVKKVETAIESGDSAAAQEAFRTLQPQIQRGQARGAMHKNTVARTLSRLAGHIKSIGQKAA